MNNTKKIVSLIREIVKQEVKKEVREIFIREGVKSMTQQSTLVEDKVVEVLPKRKSKPKKNLRQSTLHKMPGFTTPHKKQVHPKTKQAPEELTRQEFSPDRTNHRKTHDPTSMNFDL